MGPQSEPQRAMVNNACRFDSIQVKVYDNITRDHPIKFTEGNNSNKMPMSMLSPGSNVKDTANNPVQHVLVLCHPLETLMAE